jgi:type I restriction enzyme M protein
MKPKAICEIQKMCRLKENIYDYFLREVKPHVAEAWINLDATKIGYEISFNKYFYRHKPLRALKK